MSFLIIILPLSLLLILIFIFHQHRRLKPSNAHEPPGPPRLPIIGNLHQINTSSLHQSLWELSRKHGPLMSLKLGSIPALVVSSARLAEEVLKNKDTVFCSRPQMRGLRKLTYNSSDIASAPYGQEWREMRKISVLHLLSAKRIQQSRPIREDEISRMMQNIRKDAQLCKVTNLSDTLSLLTSTIICRVAFGKSFENESWERKRFDHLLDEAEAMAAGFFFSDFFPLLGWADHLTGMNSRLESIFEKFSKYFQQLIDEHLDPNI